MKIWNRGERDFPNIVSKLCLLSEIGGGSTSPGGIKQGAKNEEESLGEYVQVRTKEHRADRPGLKEKYSIFFPVYLILFFYRD